MVAKRMILCLDVYKGRAVKGVNCANLRDAGDPVEVARRYDREGADAALAASIFHYGTHSITDTKRYLADRGVAVRLTQGRGVVQNAGAQGDIH